MKNKKFLWIAVIVFSLVILACLVFNILLFSPFGLRSVYQGEQSDMSLDATGQITVGVCQVGSESVWRTANTNSIKKNLSRENGFFMRFSNARQKQENQIKTIREFISQKVDYIVLSPVTEYGWDTVLQEAKDAGIPVILMDRKLQVADESLYTCFVGTDMFTEGKLAGEWLEKHLAKIASVKEPDELNMEEAQDDLSEAEVDTETGDLQPEKKSVRIVVLKGTEGSTAEIGRTRGFMEVAKNHPEWDIVATVDADFTTTKAREVMTDIVARYSNIDVIVSQNDDMTFGAVEILDEAGITHGVDGDVKIISFDAVRKALRMVRDGIINADVECNPDQGQMIADIIKDLEAGKEVEKVNYIGDKVFTIDNVNAHISSRTY